MELHEIIGWIGNIFVIIQFTMSDMKKLRVYGIIGATIWLVVAIMINNISLMALNVIIMGIQVYHLHKIHKKEKVNVYDLPIIQDIDIDPSIKDYEIREGDDF